MKDAEASGEHMPRTWVVRRRTSSGKRVQRCRETGEETHARLTWPGRGLGGEGMDELERG